MRSRYSAYALGLGDYLKHSWHPATCPRSIPRNDQTRWLGLKIIRHEMQDIGHAVVEFIARYREGGGSAVRLHEVSCFESMDGRWVYYDGDIL